jgi:integrase
MLDLLKSRFRRILDRDQCITTHTFRKTGYLFAKWGEGDMDTIMKSARHKNFATASLYMQDADFQLQ